jgi:hypothetical protein
MITVTKLYVRSFSLDCRDVAWEILGTDEELEGYDFYVLRSVDGAAGPFDTIAGPFYRTYSFRDPGVHQLHRWRNYYYKIKVVHRESEESQEFGPAWLQAQPDLLGLEFQRRASLLLQEFSGRVAFLFPVLTFGQRCRSCYDLGPKGNSLGRATHQNCCDCFDTTYVGGFAKPIKIYLQIDPAPRSVQRTDIEEHQFVMTTARTTAFPPIKPKDMVVEAENRRWLVNEVPLTEKLRSPVRQELKLWELPRDDVKFKVPVDYALDAQYSPRREMTRPMCPQADYVTPVKDLLEES